MSSQERRLMRRMGMGAGTNAASFNQPIDPRAQEVREQDWNRNRLAERLMEIGLETLSPYDFSDTAVLTIAENEDRQPQVTLAEWQRKLASAALAAAEVIYPEIPEAGREHVTDGGPCWCEPATEKPVPAPATTGAEAILGKAVDAYLTDPRVGLHPIAIRPASGEGEEV